MNNKITDKTFLVSVIVPLYNVADYLPDCLDSIIKQDYENIEIILVNDGSTDDTEDFCLEYSKMDKRIKYIKKQNGGVSSARNLALKEMKGDYCVFVDGDDTIEPQYVSWLLNALVKNDADLSTCTIKQIHRNKISYYSQPDEVYDVANTDHILDNCECGCGRMFKSSIIHEINLQFNDKMSYGEDTDFVYRYLFHCHKIARIAQPLYNYFRRNTSATFKLNIDYYKSVYNEYDLKKKFTDYLTNLDDKVKCEYMFHLCFNFLNRSLDYYFRRFPFFKLCLLYNHIYSVYQEDFNLYFSDDYCNDSELKWIKSFKKFFDNDKIELYILYKYFILVKKKFIF